MREMGWQCGCWESVWEFGESGWKCRRYGESEWRCRESRWKLKHSSRMT